MLPQKPLLRPRVLLQGLYVFSVGCIGVLIIDSRAKKRPRVEPIPRNAFPHVIEKVN
jgi:hypothetical protein